MSKISWLGVATLGGILLLGAGCASTGAPNVREKSDQPAEATAGGSEAVREITVTGGSFYFEPKEIRVKKGEKIKIILNNAGGFHDWVLDEFNARTPQIGDGESATVEFIADKTGQFEYYCSVGQHRQMGMKGTLIVE